MRYPSLLCLSLVLGGCMAGPNYRAPQNTDSGAWQSAETSTTEAFSTDWWKYFKDPLLNQYIEKGALQNQDILIAESNILQARALRGVAASSLFPQIGADLNATKTYFSKNGPIFAIGPAAGNAADTTSAATALPFAIQIPQIQTLYNALFDMSWEIDLFGKTRRGVQAAEATIGSTIEKRNDILVSVLAEIAKNYIEVRSFQQKAVLIEEKITLLEESLKIAKENAQKGLFNQIDEETIAAELFSARAELPQTIAEVYRGIYTLSVLVGEKPEALLAEMLPLRPLPDVPAAIAVGLRSDLLRRRPDIRVAERNLATATANVGVAAASFYPTITLLGEGGFQSLKIQNLFQSNSKTWALGGDVNIPIFQGGSLIGTLRASKAAAGSALIAYQQTVLRALQEAETTLKAYQQDLLSYAEQRLATESKQKVADLSLARYDAGLTNLLDFNTNERNFIASQEILLTSQTTSLLDLVSLYKALGGGWQPQ
jgi:multidrug efflux system outer membrane protein